MATATAFSMNLETFETGSILHFLCLAGCGLSVFGLARIAKRRRDSPEFRKRLRWFVAGGCLLTWLANVIYMAWPANSRTSIAPPVSGFDRARATAARRSSASMSM